MMILMVVDEKPRKKINSSSWMKEEKDSLCGYALIYCNIISLIEKEEYIML